MAGKESHWTFATPLKELCIEDSLNPQKIYEMVHNQRDNKRKLYETALNAALENLVMWERMARADGFGVETIADGHGGNVHAIIHKESNTIEYVQTYGVRVKDEREKHD